MKLSNLAYIALLLVFSASLGCGDSSKKKEDQNTGPKITSGSVDTNVGPEKPNLGGQTTAPPPK